MASMSEFYNNSIFWVEVGRISPNPYQPRKEFNDDKIAELADSIRQYGVLQPLVVTRKETEREDGGIAVEYELIAGERRLRASKIAGIPQVPVIIRAQEETSKMKLELAIIENLQREDLNAIDRALAFKQLVDEFNLKHIEIAKKVGKSREYVSNTLRLLGLPEHIQNALVAREITEGHARPLLMLGERPQERDTLFTEITTKKLTVRESERIARRIATDKARKQDLSPELMGMEKELTETLGTRVQIEKRSDKGGKVHIDYFSDEDLKRLLDLLAQERNAGVATPPTISAAEAPDTELALRPKRIDAPDDTQDAVDTFNATFKEQMTKHTEEVPAAPQPATSPLSKPKEDPFKRFEIKTPPPMPTPPMPAAAPFTPPAPATPPATPHAHPSTLADLPPLSEKEPVANTHAPQAVPPMPDMPHNPFAAPQQSTPPPQQAVPHNPFTMPPVPPAPQSQSPRDTLQPRPLEGGYDDGDLAQTPPKNFTI
jgi:ParB family chromosome partitioning protein